MLYIRAAGEDAAMRAGIRIARESGSMKKDGVRLIPSRATSARPLDLQDRIREIA